jgi:predicted dehydrogenase
MLRPLVRGGAWQYGVRFYPVRLYEHFLACVDSIEDFVDSIRTGRPPHCNVDEGAHTVLACLAGVESFRSNRPVKVMTLEQALE